MSHIANTIDTLIRCCQPKITGADLSRASGIALAQISRIRNGHQTWISPKDLHRMSLAFSKQPKSEKFAQVHAQLLYARLKDECTGPGSPLISIELHSDGAHNSKDPQSTRPILAPSLQNSLDIIAEHVQTDPNIRDLVTTAARLCRRTTVSQPS